MRHVNQLLHVVGPTAAGRRDAPSKSSRSVASSDSRSQHRFPSSEFDCKIFGTAITPDGRSGSDREPEHCAACVANGFFSSVVISWYCLSARLRCSSCAVVELARHVPDRREERERPIRLSFERRSDCFSFERCPVRPLVFDDVSVAALRGLLVEPFVTLALERLGISVQQLCFSPMASDASYPIAAPPRGWTP